MCFAGCENKPTFSGSKTGNDNQFLADFDAMNTTIKSEMPLSEGEKVETTIDIKKGEVDILVENENGTIAYQGDDVETGNFMIEIEEAGTYTFSITGSEAEGSVHFVKSTADKTN
jgi:hypothetical protein